MPLPSKQARFHRCFNTRCCVNIFVLVPKCSESLQEIPTWIIYSSTSQYGTHEDRSQATFRFSKTHNSCFPDFHYFDPLVSGCLSVSRCWWRWRRTLLIHRTHRAAWKLTNVFLFYIRLSDVLLKICFGVGAGMRRCAVHSGASRWTQQWSSDRRHSGFGGWHPVWQWQRPGPRNQPRHST